MENFAIEEKRHRKKTCLDPVVCPICGISLRESELEAHYTRELESLKNIKKIKSPQTSPTTSKFKSRDEENSAGSSKAESSGIGSYQTYQKIKENRVRRTSKVIFFITIKIHLILL